MVEVDAALEQSQHRAHVGLRLPGDGLGPLLQHRPRLDPEVGLGGHKLDDLHPAATLPQHADRAVRHPHHPAHRHFHAHPVQIIRRGRRHIGVALGSADDRPAFRLGGLDGQQGRLPPDKQRRDHIGVDDEIAQRDERSLDQAVSIHLRLAHVVEVVFTIAHDEHSHLSSSPLRGLPERR